MTQIPASLLKQKGYLHLNKCFKHTVLTLLVLILKSGGRACLIIHTNPARTADRVVLFVIFYLKENHKPTKSSLSFKRLIETSVTFGSWKIFPLIFVAMSMDNSQNRPKETNCQDLFIFMIHIQNFSAALLIKSVSAPIFWEGEELHCMKRWKCS